MCHNAIIMKRSRKFIPEVYEVIKAIFADCAVCSASYPDIDKKKNITQSRYRIHRTSKSSFTLMCAVCEVHVTVSWKSLAEAIGKRADAIAADDEYEREYAFYAKAFEVLEKSVDIGGVIRPTPDQQLLKRLLKAKIK